MIPDTLKVNQERLDEKDYLHYASDAVLAQLAANPVLGIPVDPDVADCLGAFEETALTNDDMDSTEEFAANMEGTNE